MFLLPPYCVMWWPSSCVQGTNLDSVEREEIVVTVGGEVCTERGSDKDDVNSVSIFYYHVYFTCISSFSTVQYMCSPPDQPPGGLSEAPVVVGTHSFYIIFHQPYTYCLQVSVGRNLEYNVGTWTYRSTTTSSTAATPSGIAAALGVGIGVGVPVLIGLAIVVVILLAAIIIRRRRRRRRLRTR